VNFDKKGGRHDIGAGPSSKMSIILIYKKTLLNIYRNSNHLNTKCIVMIKKVKFPDSPSMLAINLACIVPQYIFHRQALYVENYVEVMLLHIK